MYVCVCVCVRVRVWVGGGREQSASHCMIYRTGILGCGYGNSGSIPITFCKQIKMERVRKYFFLEFKYFYFILTIHFMCSQSTLSHSL